eukprot:TRINITY_DN29123_c0_g1_i1.p1 TRINITY_DN29123_c0_g1~~TRINITY_DN29123_c0_g1_i1.p1  ORF type:complete len:619 (-),score=105.78 TRINITY_DN29123_c0_g1_i1:74-1765(-)
MDGDEELPPSQGTWKTSYLQLPPLQAHAPKQTSSKIELSPAEEKAEHTEQLQSAETGLGFLASICVQSRRYLLDLRVWLAEPYQLTLDDSSDEDGEADGKTPKNSKAGRSRPETPMMMTRIQSSFSLLTLVTNIRSRLVAVALSNGFHVAIEIAIVTSLISLGVQTNCNRKCDAGLEITLTLLDLFLSLLYVIEWCVNIWIHGWGWLLSFVNLMDTFVVWVAGLTVEILILVNSSGDSLSNLSVLRAVRGLRALRAFRVMRRFASFRTLLTGLLGTFPTLLACMVLVFTVNLTCGIISIDLIGDNPGWGLAPKGTPAWQFQQGLTHACLTLTRFITYDNMVDLIEALMAKQPFIWLFCFAYSVISSLVILNLVTAAIVDKAERIAESNQAEQLIELRLKERKKLQELKNIFRAIDADGTGEVSSEEFNAACDNPAVRDRLSALGFEQEELQRLFKLLDTDGEGSLSIEEFLRGMSEIEGQATARSMLSATKKKEKAEKRLKDIRAVIKKKKEKTKQATLDEELDNLEKLTKERADGIDNVVRVLSRTADSLEKHVQLLQKKAK